MKALGSAPWLEGELRKLDEAGLLRRLRQVESPDGVHGTSDGKPVTLFCGNDYLGLSGDERLLESGLMAARRAGAGAMASRLISGHGPAHEDLETSLARFHQSESALVFPSGYQANLAALTALARPGGRVILDRLCHASLVDGARLSGASLKVFPHNDVQALGRLLSRRSGDQDLVVTEAVFSMDGDLSPLGELLEQCQKRGALLLVDEAHATGVYGAGRCVQEGLAGEPGLLRTGTLSKALGGQGGYVLCEAGFRQWLINKGRSLIYTTGLSPFLCGAGSRALALAQEEPWRGRGLWERTRQLRRGLTALGGPPLPGGLDGGPIIPWVLGSAERAVAASGELEAEGFFVPAVRPPTVPKGGSRLRITLSTNHQADDVNNFLEILAAGNWYTGQEKGGTMAKRRQRHQTKAKTRRRKKNRDKKKA